MEFYSERFLITDVLRCNVKVGEERTALAKQQELTALGGREGGSSGERTQPMAMDADPSRRAGCGLPDPVLTTLAVGLSFTPPPGTAPLPLRVGV